MNSIERSFPRLMFVPLVVLSPVLLLPGHRCAAGEFNFEYPRTLECLAVQADGKILLGGGGITRLKPDGTVDSSFGGSFIPNLVYSLATEDAGTLLVGGTFSPSGLSVRDLGRLIPGSIWDTTFTPPRFSGGISGLIHQGENRVLVRTRFDTLQRLNPDGTLDSGFNSAATRVTCFVIQDDAKIIVADGLSQSLARLNSDGSYDPTFASAIHGWPDCLAVQPDGRILVGLMDYSSSNIFLRLMPNGELDQSFAASTNATAALQFTGVVLQSDGKILVEGRYTTLGGQACTNVGRLNPDGTLDSTFPLNSDNVVNLALEADGSVLSQRVQHDSSGTVTNTIIQRRANSGPATEALTYQNSRITWLRGGTSPEVWRTRFGYSVNGVDWTDLGPGTRIPSGWQLDGVSVPAASTVRARGYLVWARYSFGEVQTSAWFVESRLFISAEGPAILRGLESPGCGTGRIAFQYCALPGKTVVIEASIDLQHWTAIHTNVMGSAPLQFQDSDMATLPARFYRLRQEE